MTAFGKLLVFVQFIMSMLFTTWAVAIYSQRIEWAPAKTLAGEPIPDNLGKVHELAARISEISASDKEHVGPRDLAETRWQSASEGLNQATESREAYQAWYADQLALARTGEDIKGRRLESPVRQLVYNADGSLKTDNDLKVRPPVESFGKPVKSVDESNKESDDLRRQIDVAQDNLAKAVEEAAKITEEIVGSPTQFGLRRELRDERDYFSNALDEMLYLEPLYNGRTAELQVVQKRNAQLTSRLRELNAAAANR